MAYEVLPIILGLVIACVHYFSERFHLLRHIQRMKFVSFTGGVFLSYLILELFPGAFTGHLFLNRITLIFVLVGFSLFHLLEKYIYKHEIRNVGRLKAELKEIHSLAFFVYHLVIGLVMVSIFGRLNSISGILFFIIVLLIAAVSSISLKELHGKIRQKMSIKILLSISTLLGVMIGTFFPLTDLMYRMLFGFVVGAFLFIIIVDAIPRERRGEPLFFILGAALYSFLIGITWIV